MLSSLLDFDSLHLSLVLPFFPNYNPVFTAAFSPFTYELPKSLLDLTHLYYMLFFLLVALFKDPFISKLYKEKPQWGSLSCVSSFCAMGSGPEGKVPGYTLYLKLKRNRDHMFGDLTSHFVYSLILSGVFFWLPTNMFITHSTNSTEQPWWAMKNKAKFLSSTSQFFMAYGYKLSL